MDSVYISRKPKAPVSLPMSALVPHRSENEARENRIIASGSIDVVSVLSDLLASVGESTATSKSRHSTGVLRAYDNTLVIECCSEQITTTLHSIFSGHRRIHAALKKRQSEGRWMVQMHRCYNDKGLIEEVCGLVEATPACQITAEGIRGNGIVISPVHDGEQWRKYVVDSRAEVKHVPGTNHARKPCSMMMNGSISLYIEGPWFYLYEEVERMLGALENSHANNQCQLIAVDANNLAGKVHSARCLGEAMYRRELPQLAGILCLYRNNWNTQDSAITAELLRNPFSTVQLPQSFLDILRRRYKIVS